jgi:hypothetical protein
MAFVSRSHRQTGDYGSMTTLPVRSSSHTPANSSSDTLGHGGRYAWILSRLAKTTTCLWHADLHIVCYRARVCRGSEQGKPAPGASQPSLCPRRRDRTQSQTSSRTVSGVHAPPICVPEVREPFCVSRFLIRSHLSFLSICRWWARGLTGR